jgi:hypothetical protein
MTSVGSCPIGSATTARPLNITIPLDSRLCWTQSLPCITDCCSALNGTMHVSCGLDQCLGSFGQLEWRDCVKDWYIDNDVDLEYMWYSCYPRMKGTSTAVSLDISSAPPRSSRVGLAAMALLALAALAA